MPKFLFEEANPTKWRALKKREKNVSAKLKTFMHS